MIDNKLHTPEGVKDYLPNECAYKRELENRIENVFCKYGFNPITSPMFEYMEVFEGKGSIDPKQMYKFIDRDGSILTLRSDITPAIARIAATSYSEQDIPLRFYYTENAFRYNEHYQGKLREFTQAGIELIGVNSVEADAEVLAIAINSLINTGLSEFRIDIGHVQFMKGVLKEAKISEDICEKIQLNIIKKNYVAVEEIVSDLDISDNIKAIFTRLPLLIGGKELLDKVSAMVSNETSLIAIKHLQNIYEILQSYGLEKYIYFDLSVIGQFDYYTGLIFRGYAYGTGFSVIDGGRYDNLIGKFGADYPSVGFAIKIIDLMSALQSQNVNMGNKGIKTLLIYNENSRKAALSTADYYRGKGIIVENGLLGNDLEKNKLYAIKKNIDNILYFEDENTARIINLSDGTENKLDIKSLLGKEA